SGGSVKLQGCGTAAAGDGVNYTGTTDPAKTVLADACGGTPSFPAYVTFNPGGRWDRCGASTISGVKWEDVNGNHFRDPGDNGLPGWHIHITGPGFDQTATTGAGGFYSINVPGGQTYKVCEVLSDQPAGWLQSFPTSGQPPCGPGEGQFGY